MVPETVLLPHCNTMVRRSKPPSKQHGLKSLVTAANAEQTWPKVQQPTLAVSNVPLAVCSIRDTLPSDDAQASSSPSSYGAKQMLLMEAVWRVPGDL
jgi:hypothetical protein